MYDIKIEYETGNSFGSHREEDKVGCAWKDLEEAKDALKRIQAHKEYYDHQKSYSFRKSGKELEKGDWFTGGSQDRWETGEYSLFVMCDGEKKKISAFWIGYFETLLGAEIVTDETDMLYTP